MVAREAGTTRVPSQERACRTRASIVAAAVAEFSARGYAATTAKSIAARARTATGSFYQYFTSKDEVLREIAAERQRAVVTAALSGLEDPTAYEAPADVAAAARGRLRAMVDAVMRYHASDRGLHAVLTERRHADPELDALTGEGEAQIVRRIAALVERLSPTPVDATATAFVLFAAVEGAVHAHVLGRPLVDDARFVAALVDAVFRMVSFPKE